MRASSNYFVGQEVSLEGLLNKTIDELKISKEKKGLIREIIEMLSMHSPFDYEHSIRVALLCKKMADFLEMNPRKMFLAGLFHDIGKSRIPLEILEAENWDEDCAEIIKRHAILGYIIIFGSSGLFRELAEVAEIILFVHKFQESPYPDSTELAPIVRKYQKRIGSTLKYARMVALADSFDSLHRVNERYSKLSGEEIYQLILKENTEQSMIIKRLFRAGVFTKNIF